MTLGKIDLGMIQQAVRDSIPVTFRLKTFTRDQHGVLDRILEAFLSEIELESIQESLSYCTKELLANAQKANAKRIYFQEKGLSITEPEDYQNGMKRFHSYLTRNAADCAEKLQASGYEMTLTFHTSGGVFTIRVCNNCELTKQEYSRIYDRVIRARGVNSFYEALSTATDATEGAGLGIVILIQFLKRIGLDEEALSIDSEKGSTMATLKIPVSHVQLDKIHALAEVVARDIDSLPHFPENIMTLVKMTLDPSTQISAIAKKISADPTLTADLLKLTNSAYFMLPRRVTNILEAIKLIGMKGLQNLLYSYGTQKILGESYRQMRALWDHSYQTALYAFLLARSIKRSYSQLDDVYVAGILHDLGLIVVSYLHPELQEKIQKFCQEKDIPLKLLENFSYGLNHADTGALIASKWNFPEQLVEGIQCHHEPLNARLPYKDLVFCVYLANIMSNIERGRISFEQIEPPVLHDFGIQDEEQFNKIHEQFKRVYEQQLKKLSQ